MYNYVDNDDPLVDEYRKLSFEGNVFLEIGKPIWLSTVWNNMCRKAIDNNADILIMGNDDLIYKTKNWDNILLDKLKDFSDDIYCAWFDDMIHNGTEEWPCAFPIISKTWFNILGRFTLERDGFCFNDAWNYHIAKMANRTKYIPEVVVEHAHWTTGKMKADEKS